MAHKYTEEQYQFLKDNAKDKGNKELTEIFNKEFNLSMTVAQIKGAKARKKINSGLNGRFIKGQKPWNKGKKGYMGSNRTSFKKGNIPANYMPVGSERVNGDDYVDIKIADPNIWKGKHILVWEEQHGTVPEGHAIIFGDRNNRNFDIDNLICVTRAELLKMNQHRLIQEDAELTKIGVKIADLHLKIGERKKKSKEANDG